MRILLSVLLLAAIPLTAAAADGDYCRPYARDLTQKMINYIWQRAYSTCMNDVNGIEPAVPDDWQSAWKVIEVVPGLDDAGHSLIDPKKVRKLGVVPAAGKPRIDDPLTLDDGEPPATLDEPPAPVSKRSKVKSKAGNGVNDALCRKYFPASFRASDGTVIRKKGHKRVKCPK